MRVGATVVAACCVAQLALALQSRFNRPIDDEKLQKQWADRETEDWHEDSYEWKMKQAEKRGGGFNIEDLQKPGTNVQQKVLEMEATSGRMQMAFANLKEGVAKTKEEAEAIGRRWQSLLRTNSALVSVYALSETELLFTEDNARVIEVRDFVLAQPEAKSFRWKDTDFTPTPTPDATPFATKAKAKAKAVKAKAKAATPSPTPAPTEEAGAEAAADAPAQPKEEL